MARHDWTCPRDGLYEAGEGDCECGLDELRRDAGEWRRLQRIIEYDAGIGSESGSPATCGSIGS